MKTLPKVAIRTFKPSDLNRVADLEKHTFGTRGYKKTEFLEFYNKESKGFLVAHIGEELVGYVLATITIRPEDILTVVVKQGFRRKGIGKALLRSGLQYLKVGKLKQAQVVIRNDNPIAKKFFEKNSFKAIGVDDHYYLDGAAGIKMVKKL